MKILRNTLWTAVGLFALVAIVAAPATADFVIADDLIVDGSACIGFDCVNGESFGFDTIRMKENNLRIKAQDTSVAASFPTEDWQITFNSSANGGDSFFGVEDLGPIGSGTVFKIAAGAGNNAMVMSSSGNLGIGTGTPSVDIEIKDGDTPTLRLCQDGSSGFTPQTWDVAGNETNFFIRDVTNGSTLPLRIRPSAPTSSIDIEGTTGDVGFGTGAPAADIHILGANNDDPELRIEGQGTGEPTLRMNAKAGEPVRWIMEADNNTDTWSNTAAANGNFILNNLTNMGNEFLLTNGGSLTLSGSINTSDCSPCVSDYVFEEDWELMPLDELEEFVKREKHLPRVPSQGDVDRAGKLNMTQMQMRILEKVEELVLYTIDQEKKIARLTAELAELKGETE